MAARRFFFVSIGLLALAAAYHLGSRSIHAELSPTAKGHILAISGDHCFNRAGQAWRVGADGWTRDEGADLPVPVAEVKLLGEGVLVAANDHGWRFDGVQWVDAGRFRSGPVLIEGDWGDMSAHRRDGEEGGD